MPIAIYEKGTDRRLFTITEEQRDQLVDALEEEDANDHDYYIDAAVCDFLDGKIDDEVLDHLRALVGASAAAQPDNEEGLEPDDDEDEESAADKHDEEEDEDDDEDDDDDDGDGIEIEWRVEKGG